MSRRMERAPTAEDSKPEAYDETGQGAKPSPGSEPEPGGWQVPKRYSMRRKGWRKDPHGNGFLCPHASCKTGGDIHTRQHHDDWHEGIIDDFRQTDALIDDLHKGIEDRDETIAMQGEAINKLTAIVDVHSKILAQFTARGAYAIVEQVLDERARDESEPVL